MSSDDVWSERSDAERPLGAPFDGLATKLLHRLLGELEHGALIVSLPSGAMIECRGQTPGAEVHVTLHRWRALRRLILAGDLGFAEGYMTGDWSTSDLVALLEFFLRNDAAIEAAWRGLPLARLAGRLRHLTRSNTRSGSRRNIEAHYDLGNAFYAAWLDQGMNYSSALYTSPAISLEEAQIAKLDAAIALLGPRSGQRVLEIGCGWGALAERLVTRHGCNVLGITLSREQNQYAEQRLQGAGAGERAAIRMQDYRDVQGQFDGIISIEMLEAAGEAYWPVFFARLRDLLVPGGRAVLQIITIDEARFDGYRQRPDFIQRYIFPGGMLPTRAIIAEQVAAVGLRLQSLRLFGDSYARTLGEWHARFSRSAPLSDAKHLATERFHRMWSYYLAYCEVGFRTGALNVGLYQIARAG
jgi:cyclopropane-fatty-acyl-phospholipid synthase